MASTVLGPCGLQDQPQCDASLVSTRQEVQGLGIGVWVWGSRALGFEGLGIRGLELGWHALGPPPCEHRNPSPSYSEAHTPDIKRSLCGILQYMRIFEYWGGGGGGGAVQNSSHQAHSVCKVLLLTLASRKFTSRKNPEQYIHSRLAYS